MTDANETDRASEEVDEALANTTDASSLVPESTPKVVGEIGDTDATGVVGRATASTSTTYGVYGETQSGDDGATGVHGTATNASGVTYGVMGTTSSTSGYGLYTPGDARVDGTAELSGADVDSLSVTSSLTASNLVGTDALASGAVTTSEISDGTIAAGDIDQNGASDGGVLTWDGFNGEWTTGFPGTRTESEFQLLVDGSSAVRILPDTYPGVLIGDSPSHKDSASGVFVAGGRDNTVSDNHSVVCGGRGNVAGDEDGDAFSATSAAVLGGESNNATGQTSVVTGGEDNEATARDATVAGGSENRAGGRDSLAVGTGAVAANREAFVWNDNSGYHDTGDSTSRFSSDKDVAGSGVTGRGTFNVSADGVRFVTSSNTVTYISSGSAGWSDTSTRSAKTNIEPVDPGTVLDSVEELEVTTWEYKDEDDNGTGTRHIGPMAEDFHDAFDVGDSDEHINRINADGVTLAAIKGLAGRLEEKTERIADQEERIEKLERENEKLRDRLNAIERRLAPDGVADD
jgi:hypothetical protein